MTSSGPDSIFLLEDAENLLKALARQARMDGLEPIACATYQGAMATIDGLATPPRGALIDVNLGPDAPGNGFDVLAHLRRRFPTSPMHVLVLASAWQRHIVNRCFVLGVPFAAKLDFTLQQARRFFERAKGPLPSSPPRWMDEEIATMAIRDSLLSRQTRVVDHTEQPDLARMLGVCENTLKQHVRAILDESDTASLDDLVAKILHRVRRRPRPFDGTCSSNDSCLLAE